MGDFMGDLGMGEILLGGWRGVELNVQHSIFNIQFSNSMGGGFLLWAWGNGGEY